MIAWAVKKVEKGKFVCKLMNVNDKTKASHMDFHTDTCAGGKNVLLIEEYVSRKTEVLGFSDGFGLIKNIPINTYAMAYDNLSTNGITYTIMYCEILYFGKRLDHSLLCPNQIHDYRNIV